MGITLRLCPLDFIGCCSQFSETEVSRDGAKMYKEDEVPVLSAVLKSILVSV